MLSHLQECGWYRDRCGNRLPQAAVSHFRYAECLHKKSDLLAALEQLSEAERLFAGMEITWWSEQAAGLRARIEAASPSCGSRLTWTARLSWQARLVYAVCRRNKVQISLPDNSRSRPSQEGRNSAAPGTETTSIQCPASSRPARQYYH